MNADKLNSEIRNDEEPANYPEEAITEKILKCAFEVQNTLGPGFLEKVYANALAAELGSQGMACSQGVGFKVQYKGITVGDYFADLIVQERVLVELKACASLDPSHFAQVLNYLRATGIHVGLLLNFGRPKVEYRRVVC